MARTFAFFVAAAASLLPAAIGCTGTSASITSGDASGPASCAAAGGQCIEGPGNCTTIGPQNCNPDDNPGGAVCCLGRNDQSNATSYDAEMTTAAQTDATTDCTDADLRRIQTSNYDQSCANDSDCVAIVEPGGCCASATISVAATAQYTADVTKAFAGCPATGCTVSCPIQYGPCCSAGTCRIGSSECSDSSTFEDGGTDATADACAPLIVCAGACVTGSHNVSTMVDGCVVSHCCIPDDAGGDARELADGGDGGIGLGEPCDPSNNQCAGGNRCCYTSRPLAGAVPVCASSTAACNPP